MCVIRGSREITCREMKAHGVIDQDHNDISMRLYQKSSFIDVRKHQNPIVKNVNGFLKHLLLIAVISLTVQMSKTSIHSDTTCISFSVLRSYWVVMAFLYDKLEYNGRGVQIH